VVVQDGWRKLTLADKILGLYDTEAWKSTQHQARLHPALICMAALEYPHLLTFVWRVACVSAQTDYMPFEREVWWVKTARGWFSSDNSSSYKGYLRIAASALILELWFALSFRMVLSRSCSMLTLACDVGLRAGTASCGRGIPTVCIETSSTEGRKPHTVGTVTSRGHTTNPRR
jgi:hypothetical protein